MTFSSLLRCSVAIGALAAASAQASQSGVYLLQLGSFEKKNAAQERWQTLQGKYPNLLEGLSARFVDVTLPPDNFTVYRTQAGALASRANAQSICDRLTAKGDECYVVETAMFKADDMNAPVPAATAKADVSLATLATAPSAPAPSVSAPPVSVPAAPEAVRSSAKVLEQEISPPPLKVLAPVAVPAQAENTQAAQQAASAAMTQADNRDASSALLQAAAQQQAKADAISVPHVPPQDQVRSQPDAPMPPQEEEEGGFWSVIQSLDPFAEDVKEKKAAAKTPAAPKAMAAPQAPVAVAPAPQEVAAAVPASPDVFAPPPPPPPALAPQSPQPQSFPPVEAPAPITPSYTPDAPAVNAPQALMGQVPPVQPAANIPPAPPSVSQPPQPALSYTLPPPPEHIGQAAQAFSGATPIPPVPSGSSGADVEVSEAVRVPLTQGQPQAEPTLAQEHARLATPPMAMGTPSQQQPGAKTLWAQIGYFANQQHALAYWDMFRKANPSFPPVRVRITSPYKSTSYGTPQLSLRVGPFDQGAFVADICDEIVSSTKDSDYPLDCKTVVDMNESVTPRVARATPQQAKQETALSSRPALDTEMYWVQLGSFASPAEADTFWHQLTAAQKPVLDGLAPNIAPPIMSSSMEPVFRLRVGPYPLRHPADTICAGLQSRGSQCLIVFSK